MSAWITVAASLGGVALGGAIGGLSGWVLERSRQRHAEAVRWHDDRRRVYAQYFRAASTFEKAADAFREDPRDAAIQATFRDARHALDELEHEIDLIATEPVREGLMELAIARFDVVRYEHRDLPDFARRWNDYVHTLESFTTAMRKELGITK